MALSVMDGTVGIIYLAPRASRLAPRASRLAPRASRLAPLHGYGCLSRLARPGGHRRLSSRSSCRRQWRLHALRGLPAERAPCGTLNSRPARARSANLRTTDVFVAAPARAQLAPLLARPVIRIELSVVPRSATGGAGATEISGIFAGTRNTRRQFCSHQVPRRKWRSPLLALTWQTPPYGSRPR